MSTRPPEPERWSRRPAGGQAAEDRFGEAFRAVATWSEPDGQMIDRGRRHLHRPEPWRRGVLVPAVVALALLAGGGGAVWATRGVWRSAPAMDSAGLTRKTRAPRGPREARPFRESPAPFSPPATGPSEAPDSPPPPRAPEGASPGQPRPAPTRLARDRSPLRSAARASAPASPISAPPSPTPATPAPASGEAALLGEAFRKLRADRDGAAALALLDEHARRFPLGDLQPEAAAARVEALMLLERHGEARAELRRYLLLHPKAPFSDQARRLLEAP